MAEERDHGGRLPELHRWDGGGGKATTNTFVANGTLRATASWNTNEATQSTLGGVALYNTSTAAVGTCGSVATFSTSNKTTDQTLNITYEWRFS